MSLSLFQKIVTDLRKEDLTQQDIAEAIGISQPNVVRLERETDLDPRWSSGDQLIKLHASSCSKTKIAAVNRLIKGNPARRRRR